MYNIDEAAERYIDKQDYESLKEDDKLFAAFKAGAEFTQRWINIEEKLPTKAGRYLVKRKINMGKEWIAIETWATSKGVGYWENYLYITHWRPIEVK